MMSSTAHDHNDGGTEDVRWDAFIFWARKFHDMPDFDATERDYKLIIGTRLDATRNALFADSGNWIDLLKTAVGPPNNLTQWQDHDNVVKWCRTDPVAAAAALRIIWDPERSVAARFDDFVSAASASVRVSIAMASFLHIAMDQYSFPMFRATPVEQAMNLTGYATAPVSGRFSIGTRYENYLGFLDRIIKESALRGFSLRDPLDAQSVIWAVTKWSPPKEWSEEERASFRVFRGEQSSAPGGIELPIPDGGPTGIPAASREQLLAEMEKFDEDERDTEPWLGWETNGRFKWAIVEQGKRYPVKHIISAATGIATERFSGGDQANDYVRQRGFQVQPLRLTDSYRAPTFDEISRRIAGSGMRLDEQTLRRYHLSLKTRGFVILAGVSGTGKTWLAEAYAESVGAEHLIVPVAPNWTSNEDLLGFFNPLTGEYHDTSFSRFLRDAEQAYERANSGVQTPQPFHLILDEMNLARVEHYFAGFLSAMEVRARNGTTTLDLGPHDRVRITPNLCVIGTVNIDETTHGFADKVYDRAQLVELALNREDIEAHLDGRDYQSTLLEIWDAVLTVGPFAFRVLDEISAYVDSARALGIPWETALDEQLAQKILPKLNGAKVGMEDALERIVQVTDSHFPLTNKRATLMLEGYRQYGFVSYFA